MEVGVLRTVGEVAGIGGLAIGALLLVFRQIIAAKIFPMLTKEAAYRLMRLISTYAFVIGIAGIGAWTWVETTGADGGSPAAATTGGESPPAAVDTSGSAADPADSGQTSGDAADNDGWDDDDDGSEDDGSDDDEW